MIISKNLMYKYILLYKSYILFNYIYFENIFLFQLIKKIIYLNIIKWGLGIGDWGLGIGDWEIGRASCRERVCQYV